MGGNGGMAGAAKTVRAPAAPVPVAGDDYVIEAIILASRAMVGIAARSLSEVSEDVTLAQYRTLAVLSAQGPRRLADLAEALEVSPSTATRMCDRLVKKTLVQRVRDDLDRREVNLSLTDSGRHLVQQVIDRRRERARELLDLIPDEGRPALVESLTMLAAAAGETPEPHWSPGWSD
jgi:DNA-binding MarR family transcriptional regulator